MNKSFFRVFSLSQKAQKISINYRAFSVGLLPAEAAGLRNLQSRIPLVKLVLGVPFYFRSFFRVYFYYPVPGLLDYLPLVIGSFSLIIRVASYCVTGVAIVG